MPMPRLSQAHTPATTPSLAITWSQPTFLLPLFALCSLLGVSNSLAAAIGLALTVSLAVFVVISLAWALSSWMPESAMASAWLLLSAAVIAALELILHAAFFELYRALGIFLPLTIVACLLLTRQEMRAEYRNFGVAMRVAARTSSGFLLACTVLGAARELVGHGSLFHEAGALLGAWAAPLELTFFRANMGFLLAVLAPGAFIGLGLGVALYNWLWLQFKKIRHE